MDDTTKPLRAHDIQVTTESTIREVRARGNGISASILTDGSVYVGVPKAMAVEVELKHARVWLTLPQDVGAVIAALVAAERPDDDA